MLATPIVFIVFNRPDTTRRVFEAIRAARPIKLFLLADGPRAGIAEDVERCRVVLEIIDNVDWPCEVVKEYSPINLGCRQRVISGLNMVFSCVPEAIILEDDCLPHPSFFKYCEELLDQYRNDERIMAISGNNYLFDKISIQGSYYFSSYTHIWGWATWARTWNQYDPDMADWPKLLSANWLSEAFPDRGLRRYWERIFEFTYRGLINTWALQLNYLCLVKKRLTIVPCVNLVTNIGFGCDATTTCAPHCLADVPADEMTFPLRHPNVVERNYQFDIVAGRNIYFRPILPLFLATPFERLKRKKIRWPLFLHLLLL
jgi:hypothetical protein